MSRPLRGLAALLTCLTLAASPALAAPPKRIVQALLAAAQSDFQAGRFAKAAEAYIALYRQDPQPPALYNAGRSFDLAGNLDKAEESYREFLELGGHEPATVTKVQGYLADLQAKRADHKAEEATAAERSSNYAIAFELWRDAVRHAPTRLVYVARGGRAAHLAGKQADAQALYRDYLAKAAANAPERADVEHWRAELALAAPAPGRPSPGWESGESAQVRVMETESAPSRTPAVAALLGGGTLVLAGGAVLALASMNQAELDEELAQRNANKLVDAMTYSQAQGRASEIENQYLIGWAVTGAGVVALGAGTWLWLRGSDKVAVTLAPNGVVMAGRF